MGTHPIFESDFDCLTEMTQDADAGAEYLASIFGTEKDKVNCSFYFKIGACHYGDRCSRLHNKPTFSQTMLLQNLYRSPILDDNGGQQITESMLQRHYDEFYEEVFFEIEDKYGEIEEMNVCENLGDHLVGNGYIKFYKEEDCERSCEAVNDRWFAGQPVQAELSPVTNFREACCRDYEMGECTRGGFCNFMHLKPISKELRKSSTTAKSGEDTILTGDEVDDPVRVQVRLAAVVVGDMVAVVMVVAVRHAIAADTNPISTGPSTTEPSPHWLAQI